jgi:hypothetical protein
MTMWAEQLPTTAAGASILRIGTALFDHLCRNYRPSSRGDLFRRSADHVGSDDWRVLSRIGFRAFARHCLTKREALPMQMQQIRYFVALCQTLNFTAAALRCGVSQPSLTTAIGALERELGGALFERKPSIALTGLGSAVRPHLDEVARNVDQARAVARMLTLYPNFRRSARQPTDSQPFA